MAKNLSSSERQGMNFKYTSWSFLIDFLSIALLDKANAPLRQTPEKKSKFKTVNVCPSSFSLFRNFLILFVIFTRASVCVCLKTRLSPKTKPLKTQPRPLANVTTAGPVTLSRPVPKKQRSPTARLIKIPRWVSHNFSKYYFLFLSYLGSVACGSNYPSTRPHGCWQR
jgi:hypothetical protein